MLHFVSPGHKGARHHTFPLPDGPGGPPDPFGRPRSYGRGRPANVMDASPAQLRHEAIGLRVPLQMRRQAGEQQQLLGPQLAGGRLHELLRLEGPHLGDGHPERPTIRRGRPTTDSGSSPRPAEPGMGPPDQEQGHDRAHQVGRSVHGTRSEVLAPCSIPGATTYARRGFPEPPLTPFGRPPAGSPLGPVRLGGVGRLNYRPR